jgi:hypothetical protein
MPVFTGERFQMVTQKFSHLGFDVIPGKTRVRFTVTCGGKKFVVTGTVYDGGDDGDPRVCHPMNGPMDYVLYVIADDSVDAEIRNEPLDFKLDDPKVEIIGDE